MSRIRTRIGVMLWLITMCLLCFGTKSHAAQPQVRVLAITRGDYGGANDLSPGPESDGTNFERVLENAYGSQIVSMVTKAKEGVTTVAGVEAAIRSTFADSTEDDINYFYYSGHGKSTGLYLSSSAVMTATELAVSFEGIKGTNILVMDCCYSGGMAARSVETVSGSEAFLDSFVEEFQEAAESMEGTTSMKARSSLTNSKFKLLMASGEEELSWQMSYEELEEVYLGGFTTTLSFGCGIDPRLVNERSNYQLDVVAADYDMDGIVSINEITRFIQNTYHYAMNHVRVYPADDDSMFLPVAEELEPYITFDKACLARDEETGEDTVLEVSYRAANKGRIAYAIYCDTTYSLSLLPYNDLEYSAKLQNYTNIKQVAVNYTYRIGSASMDGNDVISIPVDEFEDGNYLIVLQTEGQSIRYMIPFTIARTENEDLADNFYLEFHGSNYIARSNLYEAEEGKELGIKADFGLTSDSETACPYLTCIVYDAEGNQVKVLGDRELMEIVPTKFVGSSNVMSEGVCYRNFYWDGKDAEGNPVADGIYIVEITATGAVEDVLQEEIQVKWKEQENVVKESGTEGSSDGSVITKDTEKSTEETNNSETTKDTEKNSQTESTEKETLKAEEVTNNKLTLSLNEKRLILPLEDGEEGVEITFTLPGSGKVSLDVIRVENGREETVRKLLTNQSLTKDDFGYRIYWDGVVDGRTDAPSGYYVVELRFTDSDTLETLTKRSDTIQVADFADQQQTAPPEMPIDRPEVKQAAETEAQNAPTGISALVGTKSIVKAAIGVKEKLQLTPSLKPANSKTTVTYTSSNTAVAAVSASGQVVGKKAGKAVITMTTFNKKVCSVTITVKQAPKKITLSAKKKTLKAGKTFKVKVKFPAKSASYKITYTSSKKSVATVDETGKIKAIKKGKAVITAKTFNGKKAKITITVK